ncbi:unnamed protein product [Linum tenue]|uniref:Cytochrome P450 n=1 Tax=Linum tenue TaxID=586396 RepID=A0AAV0LZ74_9ROSI|nr:unnamed protein product [Linum tenue]
MRKICTLELLSAKRVQSFRHIREEEVSNLVDSLTAASGEPVDLTRMLSTVTSSITSRAAFGKAQELTDAFMVVIENISVLDQVIEDHKSRRRAGRNGDGEKEDLVDVLLNLQEKQNLGEMFLAGIETSTTVMEWVMSAMINDSRVLQKAQQEVRQVYGGDDGKNHFGEAKLDQLKYLDMVIAESLRLHPPLPLLIPRENRDKNVSFGSYEVSVNTNVIVNAWAINRDPRYWTEAERFFPERFVDCPIDYTSTDLQFIPFGAGRRMCPGVSFGMKIVKLTLASLIFHFDWKLPAGQKNINMTGCFRATLRRQYALHLIPITYGRVLP